MASTSNDGWVNLQDYLGLNKDQGQTMASNVYGNVAQDTTAAGQQIQSDSSKFKNASDAGTLTGPNGNAWNAANDASLYGGSAGAGQQAARGYSGPNTLSDVDANLGTQVASAMQRVQNTQSQQGLGTEINNTYGGKSASGIGGSAMDSFLTGTGGAGTLNQLGTAYGGLANSLGLAEENANNTAAANTAKSQAAAQQWGQLQSNLAAREKKFAADTVQANALAAQRAWDAAGNPGAWVSHAGHRGDVLVDSNTTSNGEYDTANDPVLNGSYTGPMGPAPQTLEQWNQMEANREAMNSGPLDSRYWNLKNQPPYGS